VAFYAKKVGGTSVFWAAIIGEIFVVVCFCLDKYNIVGIGFLWLNVIGAVLVFLLAVLFSKFKRHAI
jgi:glycopeptide antibiotics resistance protein